MPKSGSEEEGSARVVVYRKYFEKLLKEPKPLRDQLIIELAALQGFRTGEIGSFRWEYVDFERGLIQVLDSKKHKLFTLPMHPVLAKHLMEYQRECGFSHGFIFESKLGRPSKLGSKQFGISKTFINYVWSQWCYAAGVPSMSPRYGRAFFACVWIFVYHKSMKGLQCILRHDQIGSTEFYLNKLCSFEDVVLEFFEGLESPFIEECARFANCPMSTPGCRCKFSMPKNPLEESLIPA